MKSPASSSRSSASSIGVARLRGGRRWENYRDTETAVRNEAKALADLHAGLLRPAGRCRGQDAQAYGHISAAGPRLEWQAMAHGSWIRAAEEEELQHLGRALFGGSAKELKDVALFDHALDLMTIIHDNRNERPDSSDGTVPTALWLVLLAGALITLGYPSFFGTSNLNHRYLMIAALASARRRCRLRSLLSRARIIHSPATCRSHARRSNSLSRRCRSRSRRRDSRGLSVRKPA